MNTKQQLFIDQLIAKPIAFCLNFLVRLLGKILSIDHSLDIPFKRIVVCKFKGLGSIIQSTPMLQSLKQAYPDASITFLSTRANAPFLNKIDVIDKVIVVDDSSIWKLINSFLKAIFQLLRNRPEIYIDLEIYSNFSSLVAVSVLAKNRIGFYLSSSSFKMGIYTHMMYYNTNVPISQVYMQIARLINKKSPNQALFPIYKNIHNHPKFSFSNYIIINPNASDLRIERRWDNFKFKDLAIWLCTNFSNKTIVFIGSPSEQSYVNDVLKEVSFNNLINLSGKTSVEDLIQLIHNAELVITNDTGPMHIAFACNTPTIALFGPSSPVQYGQNCNAKIIYKQTYCSPCVHEFITPPCKGNNSCMQLISVEEVINEVRIFYNNKLHFLDNEVAIEKINYFKKNEVLGMVHR